MVNKILRKGIMILAAACMTVGLLTAMQPQTVCATELQGASLSSDATLKSLSISTGTISPEFSPEITEYTVTVSEDVEKINVTCSTSAADSTVVEAGGFKDLEMGSNDALITVQAADGTRITYNLTIIRGEASAADDDLEDASAQAGQDNAAAEETAAPEISDDAAEESIAAGIFGEGVTTVTEADNPIDPNAEFIPVGGDTIYAQFQVNSTFPAELMPEGFVMENYSYRGVNVQSAYFALGDIRLLYLCAADGGSANFRIYYEDTDTFMDYVRFEGTDGKFIMPVRYQAQIKIPDNYTGSYLPWSDKVVACYIYTELTDNPIQVSEDMADMEGTTTEPASEAEPVKVEDLDEEVEFYLIYAMNNEGVEGFYLYDIVEETYQRYVERDTSYELDQSYFKYKDLAHQRFGILCVLAVLLVIAVFAVINLFLQNRELKAELDDEEDDEDNDEDDDEENDEDDEPKKPITKKEAPVKKEPVKAEPVKKPAEKKVEVPVKDAEPAVDAMSLEEKIISQLQMTPEEKKEMTGESVRPRKPSSFKMINLSREPEPSGLDDDFEFEFINLDDE